VPNSGATFEDDLDRTVTDYHLALAAFFKGDPEPCKRLYSHHNDVSLANPFGPPARGWSRVAQTMEQAAAHYRDGRATGFDRVAEYTTGELAYIVEIEHFEAKIAGHQDMAPIALRVTTVLRPEDEGWKVVHRHADPITTPRFAESVIQPDT
jgi:ketosteroid isomerase-like protein